MLTSFSIYVLVQRLLDYYPNYATHRLYFGEVETPYIRVFLSTDNYCNVALVFLLLSFIWHLLLWTDNLLADHRFQDLFKCYMNVFEIFVSFLKKVWDYILFKSELKNVNTIIFNWTRIHCHFLLNLCLVNIV